MNLYRLTFSRSGACAWIAHLDLMTIFERAFRRASLPLQWSQGFNPRPTMIFALPLGVGVEAESELMDVELEERMETSVLLARLAGVFPEGIRVYHAEEKETDKVSLMSKVVEAVYRYEGDGVGRAFRSLWAGNEALRLLLERKGKEKEVNLRELVLETEFREDDSFRLRCLAGSRSNMRPDLPLLALAKHGCVREEAAADTRIVRECLLLETCSTPLFDAPAEPGL